MSASEELQKHAHRVIPPALVCGVGALIVCVIGAFFNPAQFYRSYLFAFLFWFGIASGSLGILMMHHLTGGAWGFIIRRLLEAATMTLPLLALLFVPIFFGMGHLWSWTHPAAMAAIATQEELKHKGGFFFNVPWFIGRAIGYFVIWIGIAVLLRRWSLEQDRTGDPALTEKFQHFCGPALVIYVLAVSMAAIDWIMALEPLWYSTIFGMVILVGEGVGAFAFMIGVAVRLAGRNILRDLVSPDNFRDLGNMMLAFILLWTYAAFSQYLIIWSGNISKESIWYLDRSTPGWPWIGRFLIGFHFLVPFFLLLFGNVKRNYRMLMLIAVGVLIAHLVDVFWLVMPPFYRTGLNLHWMDVLLVIGIGGIWIAVFAWQATKAALVPLHDPRLEGTFHAQEALERG